MTMRDNALAILRGEPHEQIPLVSFGYWFETLDKWLEEGHITQDEARDFGRNGDNCEGDLSIMKKLGFDLNWQPAFTMEADLFPKFDEELLEEKADGSRVIRDSAGLIVLVKPGVTSIPAEIGTSLTDRKVWESMYLPRMQWSPDRINHEKLARLGANPETRERPLGLHCGSLMGTMRNLLGVEQLSYLYADDDELFAEIVETFGNLSYRCVEAALESGVKFDYAHFWEDICFKNGPLIHPGVFEEYVGPQYKRITRLLNAHGIDIISVDCDGLIDSLITTWLDNGVNTMFPIEVGTWDASIAPWREKYGPAIKGVGGMNKNVFGQDRAAIDKEIERLKRLVALGRYIPCPDHRIPPDAIFENVQYYCEQMRGAMQGM